VRELDDYLTECGTKAFKWGEHDCVLFASNWAKIYTGIDFLESYASWDSELSAAKILTRGGGLEQCIISVLGEPIKTYPKDGDIALLPDKLGGLCIVYGAYVVGPAKPIGLNFHPFTDTSRFWRLPCQTQLKK
jgi:hypothetical protein